MGRGCPCVVRSPLSDLVPTLHPHLPADAWLPGCVCFTLPGKLHIPERLHFLSFVWPEPPPSVQNCSSCEFWPPPSPSLFSLCSNCHHQLTPHSAYFLRAPTLLTRIHVPEGGWLIFALLLYVPHRVGLQMLFESVIFLSK